MSQYAISVDLSGLLAQLNGALDPVFPRIAAVVQKAADGTAYAWKQAVAKAPKLSLYERQNYINSIGWRMDGDYAAVVSTSWGWAQQIENGRPARDLKAALQTSAKVRRVTSGPHAGLRYLIIPFRHNVPGGDGEGALAQQMPSSVYALAQNLNQSSITSTYSTPSVQTGMKGVSVKRRNYLWGGALPAGLAPKLKPHHATDPYAGMVRMKTNAPGSPTSSAYLTFRVMGEWSNGWLVGARPGQRIAAGVAEKMRPAFESAIAKAVQSGL